MANISVNGNELNNVIETNASWPIFVIVYGLILILGSALNTILLIVFIQRPSFRIHLSNR